MDRALLTVPHYSRRLSARLAVISPPTYIFPFVKEPGLLPKKGDFIALLLLSIRSDHAPQANIVISCEGNQGRFCRRIHLARCSSPDQTARAHCSSQVAPPRRVCIGG